MMTSSNRGFFQTRLSRAKLSIGILGILATLLIPSIAWAAFNFADFSSLVGLTLNGDAAQNGTDLRLVPAVDSKKGSAWNNTQQFVHGFDTTFQFRISNPGGAGGGADGFAFLIQNSAAGTAALGGGGGNIGYMNGIENSLVIEFDTFDNGAGLDDVAADHIGVYRMTSTSDVSTAANRQARVSISNIEDSAVHTARIVYVPGNLQVFLDNVLEINAAVDIPTLLNLAAGGKAQAGFTAATGAGRGNHDILSWSFDTTSAELADGCNEGNGGNDINVVEATSDGTNIEVHLTLCANIDPQTQYKVHFDHTSPFATENNPDCETTSDDTMKLGARNKETGPGVITPTGNMIWYSVTYAELGLSGGDTVLIWADTNKKNEKDRAPNTDGGNCNKPDVETELIPLTLHNPASCQGIVDQGLSTGDGDYTIFASGRPFTVYCDDMAGTPSEFLTLTGTNFSQYTCGGASPCGATACANSPFSSVRTDYQKVRIDPVTLLVDINDQTFATSTGDLWHSSTTRGCTLYITSMAYGVAQDCLGAFTQTGVGKIDLTGTPFKVVDPFATVGFLPAGSATFSAGDQVVDLTGGGFCGAEVPVGALDLAFLP